MFSELCYRDGTRWRASHGLSIAAHAAVIIAIVASRPMPRFVTPSYLMRGNGGAALQTIYLDATGKDDVIAQVSAPKHLRVPPKPADKHLTLPREEAREKQEIAAAAPAARAGSPIGSATFGSLTGHDVRPALPVVGPRPFISETDLPQGVQGDVVVEITIDERGGIVSMRFVKKLGYGVDEKVLSALEQWHFTPATQDGVAIPSQQLVLFHFPS